MRVHTSLETIKQVRRPVLTTGTFDGVHRGHRTMLQRLTAIAKEEGGKVCYSRFIHILECSFSWDNDLKLLCTQERRSHCWRPADWKPARIPFSGIFPECVQRLCREFLGVEIVSVCW